MKNRLLFLVGYRGAGKSEVARMLAPMLGWAWLDADAALEERHGRSIREIFASEGEAGFRAKESALLHEWCGLRDHVIATGGGIILREENRAALKGGAVVWLRAPAEILWQRMQADAASAGRRPDLAQGGLAEVEAMLRVREPIYQACQDFTVDVAERSPSQVAEAIVGWFGRAEPREGPG